MLGILVIAAGLAAPHGPFTAADRSVLQHDYGWAAGTIAAQLDADTTLVPFGKGAIFVPAMTNPLDEPPVTVWQADKRIAEGTTGHRIIVAPGTYEVRVGSGTVKERLHVQVSVRELHTSVVPVSWAGLAVHVVDEQYNSLRGSYEIIRVDDREYLGLGFGTDEQGGEPVSTWILRPGLYKIVRVGETYRARQDFATVRLLPGHLTDFLLVLGDTGNFVGAGEVQPQELFATHANRFWASLVLGGDLSFNSRSNVLGSPNGDSYAFRAFLDSKLSAPIFGSPLILRLQVEEGQTKGPGVPWQKTQDRADLDGLYVYHLEPWIGPYLRANVETNLVEGWQYFDKPQNIVILNPKGAVVRRHDHVDRLMLSPPLGLTTIKEGLGLNMRLFKTLFAETTLRVGIGARHRIINHLLEPTDNTQTAGREFQQVKGSGQVGVESTLLAVGRIGRWVLANVDVDSLVPFENLSLVVVELEGTLALKLTSYLSVNYVFRYLRDRSLSHDDRIEHDVLLRFSVELL